MTRFLVSMIFAATVAACGGKAKGPDTAGGGSGSGSGSAGVSLYDRLGRRDAIAIVVKDFVEQRVAKDNRINASFAHVDLPGLEARLIDQICQLTGGPCTYTGKDMKTAHAELSVKESDYTAFVDDLKAALDHARVPASDQQELIGKLATMHDAIVTVK